MEPHLVPKLLFHVLVREIHNSMVLPPEEGGLKEAGDTDNNIIISDSDLRKIYHPTKEDDFSIQGYVWL